MARRNARRKEAAKMAALHQCRQWNIIRNLREIEAI